MSDALEEPRRRRAFPARLLGLLLAVIGVALCVLGTRGLIRGQASVEWPAAEGRIVTSSVERDRTRGSDGHWRTMYRPDVRYQYDVSGRTHRGARVTYGDIRTSSRPYAERIVGRYPEGAAVTVYYMPGQPEESLLEPGLNVQSWFLPGVGVVFAVAGGLLVLRSRRTSGSPERRPRRSGAAAE